MARIYHTRHREALIDFLGRHSDEDYTVAQLHQALEDEGYRMGIATLYRQVRSLLSEGSLSMVQKEDGAEHFHFLSSPQGCFEHYHLKCKLCGRLYHLECQLLHALEEHMLSEHHFRIDRRDSLIYGWCEECSKKEGK